tara:strand:+ start:3917 stop:4780 length:864 start_codon:yes stop_codon:yes gene_type:complete
MAINFSPKQIKRAKINFYGGYYSEKNQFLKLILHIYKRVKIRIVNYINYLLRIKFKLLNNSKKSFNYKLNFQHLSHNIISESSSSFIKNGYCYLENFLNEENYVNLKNNWPHKCFFYEADSPEKNYNFAFRYCVNKENEVYPKKEMNNIKYFLAHQKFYHDLENSNEFGKLLYRITTNPNFKFYSAATSYAKQGSYLAPHIDSVYNLKSKKMLNIIYFVDGSENPTESGGTGIYADSDFEQPLLTPQTLKNSVLIYNSMNNFFHGFDIMRKNSFRHAITFQFLEEKL